MNRRRQGFHPGRHQGRPRATVRLTTDALSLPATRVRSSSGFGPIIVLALASIIFLSVILIVAAVMMRGHIEKLGQREEPPQR